MIEPIMYIAIGFLVATLLGLALMPLVHGRAVRLTTKRLEASAPVSRAEIQADKDQLRAEFAMNARKLEMSIDQLRSKTTVQAAELGKKTDAINRMKVELGARNAEILALQAREQTLAEQLRTTSADLASTAAALQATQQALAERESEASRLSADLADQSRTAENRRTELVAVHEQIDTLKQRVDDIERDYTATQAQLEAQRSEAAATARERDEARERIAELTQRVTDLDQQLVAQLRAAEDLGRQTESLREQLAPKTAALAERDDENSRLRAAREEAETAVKQLRDEVFALNNNRSSPALATLQAEHAGAAAKLQALREEREKFQREQAENAVLRERINDIAAEVAHLTMALEGSDSPIKAILASESKHRAKGGSAAPQTLADRIRALQAKAGRSAG